MKCECSVCGNINPGNYSTFELHEVDESENDYEQKITPKVEWIIKTVERCHEEVIG